MTYNIRKAAVIGAGTMGGGIAALLTGVGVETVLLDIPAKGTQPGDPPAKRNAVVQEGVKRIQTLRPAQPFILSDLSLLRTGNTEDNLDMVSDADWIIEVVFENLEVKRALMGKLIEYVSPNAIISTNTSGIPIRAIAEGFDHEFTHRFLGTHFFNPPRYLHLMEVIPHPDTDPEVVDFITGYGTQILGKGVVLCKDTPNFIGNRFMTMAGTQILNYALDNGFTVEEVDNLTGPLIGRPKTATFRLNDLVGFDIAAHVAENLYDVIPNDPAREVLRHPKMLELTRQMLERKWLGNKTGQGFYKQMKGADGAKEFWPLNLDTFEYESPKSVRFESVGKHRKVENTGERIKRLMNEQDRAAQFLWHMHAFLLAYASQRVPEITETIVNVDNAQKWGFSHEMGPFEIWDAIGVAETMDQFDQAGYPVADWVRQMVKTGHPTFYQRDSSGQAIGYYSPQDAKYLPLETDRREITVKGLRAKSSKGDVARNSGASVLDMGDGVALLELHTDHLTLDADVFEMTHKALALLDRGDFDALVIGHDGERWCIGANVMAVGMAVQSGQLSDLEAAIKAGQDTMQAIRSASKPVVTAPFNMALGGGVELLMTGTRIVAHAELYAGLVEFGVGIIPSWGGCKELLRRVVNPVMESSPNADVLPHLQKVFQQIATAKVSASAKEARDMGFLGPCDRIVMNRSHLLGEAKREALYLADGFRPQRPGKIYAAGRDVYAALLLGIEGFQESGIASEYDAHIARKLAYVLTGGAISEPGWVDEQVILDLEREALMSLVTESKTLERMTYMLQYNKPLRN